MVKGIDGLAAGFVLLALVLSAGFVAAVHWSARKHGMAAERARGQALAAAALTGAWLAVTGGAAALGLLGFESPPTMMVALLAMFAIVVGIVRSGLGERLATTLPLWTLVGWQAFRLPLELLMHRAFEVGLMPKQMSFEGLNFDVLTGATAVVVAGLLRAGKAPPGLVRAWNVMGSLLLLVVVLIALLSAPLPVRVFMNEPANVWVTLFPFVWLPMVMVATAFLGHALVFRRLRHERERSPSGALTPGAESPGPDIAPMSGPRSLRAQHPEPGTFPQCPTA
jgi:hypothetical protein